jgi:secreted PhoX family phosphatase
MLGIEGLPQYETGTAQTVGMTLPTTWIRIENPDPEDAQENASAIFEEGWGKGGASFLGLEGAWFANGSVYFSASDGGDKERGQIWRFTPRGMNNGVLELVFESGNRNELDGPDNITISPKGAILICEDGDGAEWIDGDDSCRVTGDNLIRFVTPAGSIFDFAKVNQKLDLVLDDPDDFEEDCTARPLPGVGEVFGFSETAGPCFSPDGKWLFVNLQKPGITIAITGPWHKGAL